MRPPQRRGADDRAHVRHGGRRRRLVRGQRLAAAFEALAAGRCDGEDGAHRGVQFRDLPGDCLVGQQHGKREADGNRQHGHHGRGSDLVSKGVAYTPGKDAHVTPRDLRPAGNGRRLIPHWYGLLCGWSPGAMDPL